MEAPRRQTGISRRKQQKAFLMFSQGLSIHQVSERLNIPYSEAQRQKIIYLKSEEKDEGVYQEVTEFYKDKLGVEREFSGLDDPELGRRLGVVRECFPDSPEIFIFPPGGKRAVVYGVHPTILFYPPLNWS